MVNEIGYSSKFLTRKAPQYSAYLSPTMPPVSNQKAEP